MPLTKKQIEEVRNTSTPLIDLAKKFGVSQSTVWRALPLGHQYKKRDSRRPIISEIDCFMILSSRKKGLRSCSSKII